MSRVAVSIVLSIFILVLLACTAATDVAGTGTQAGNGYLSGVVISSTGETVSGASVWVRSADFLADTSSEDSSELYETISDDSGRFSFDSLPDGDYAVEIRENDSTMAMHRFSIAGNNHDAGRIAVEAAGSYFGTVDTSLIAVGSHFHARVYGLNIRAEVSRFGEFYYPRLPAGMQILHILAADPAIGLIAIDTVYIEAGTADTSGTPYQFPESYARDSIVIEDIITANGLSVSVEDVSTVGSNGRVTELVFDNVGLKHTVPALVHLTKLQKLVITNNPDFTIIEGGLEKLTELTHLDLSGNGLVGLPVAYTTMTNLTYLSVDDNRLNPGPALDPAVIDWIDTYSANPDWKTTQRK